MAVQPGMYALGSTSFNHSLTHSRIVNTARSTSRRSTIHRVAAMEPESLRRAYQEISAICLKHSRHMDTMYHCRNKLRVYTGLERIGWLRSHNVVPYIKTRRAVLDSRVRLSWNSTSLRSKDATTRLHDTRKRPRASTRVRACRDTTWLFMNETVLGR